MGWVWVAPFTYVITIKTNTYSTCLKIKDKLSLLEGGGGRGGKGTADSAPQNTSASSYTAYAYAVRK